MTKDDKETHLIPMKVTSETIMAFGINKEDVILVKIRNKIISAIMVPATKEQYEAFMYPI